MIIDRDGNSWERCQECDRWIPYPKSMCESCVTLLERDAPTAGEIAMFAYGSLRIGAWNADVGYYTRDPVGECETNGRIYFVTGAGGYPVAKLDEEGTIYGDVVFYDESSYEWGRVFRMECGAGYVLRDVAVRLPEGREMGAVAWHYIGTPRGRLIESGNWLLAAGIG